jgi:hypothetical protein
VEVLTDGAALLDERVIRFATDLLSVLTGFSREELVYQNVRMLVPKGHRDAESQASGRYLRELKTRLF